MDGLMFLYLRHETLNYCDHFIRNTYYFIITSLAFSGPESLFVYVVQ